MNKSLTLWSGSDAGTGTWHDLAPSLAGPYVVVGLKDASDQITIEGRVGAVTAPIDAWTAGETAFARSFDAPYTAIRAVKAGSTGPATVVLRSVTHG